MKPTYRLLIVDDDPGLGDLVASAFERTHSYEIWVARDAPTGLRLALTKRPHLILLDVHLSDNDGISTLTQLKHMNSTKEIPVMMLTGDAIVDVVQNAIAAGACDYILKPFRIEYLMSRVHDRLSALP